MTPSSSPPVPPDPPCAVCSKPIQSGYIQTQMGEVVHTSCRSEEDQTRLTRAWAMRCGACHHPLGDTDAKFIVGYVPAGETLSWGTTQVHLRCLELWVSACLRSDPGRDAFPA